MADEDLGMKTRHRSSRPGYWYRRLEAQPGLAVKGTHPGCGSHLAVRSWADRFLDHRDNKSPYVSGGCQHNALYTIINRFRYSDYCLMDEVYS